MSLSPARCELEWFKIHIVDAVGSKSAWRASAIRVAAAARGFY